MRKSTDKVWPRGQAVKTSPFHGGNTGSIPVGVINWDLSSAGRASALQAEGHRFEPCRSHLTNSFISYADVAQLAEQLICNQQVIGSSPIIGFTAQAVDNLKDIVPDL